MAVPTIPPRARDALLALLLGAILFLPGLGNHDLWNPNEPVFAEGAREMWERGDWLLPYVNGQVYQDKPILFFWAILAAARLDGEVTAWAARLPSALASLLCVAAVAWFGRREFRGRAGLLAGLVLATSPVFLWEARFAQMDPMLTAFVFLTLVCFHRARRERPAAWLAAAGAWSGLAVLTKGPVGLVLPGAAALAVLAWERDLRFLWRPAWVVGAAAFALVAVPWYAAVGFAGHTDTLAEFFLRQNITRFVDPFDHARPFYYYGLRLLTDLFPWSFLAPAILVARPERRAPEAPAWRLCVALFAVVLLFFSASGAKRGVYILPLYPAFALLAGRALAGGAGDAERRGAIMGARGLAAAGALFLLGGAALPLAAGRRYPEFLLASTALGIVAAVAGAVILLSGLRRTAIAASLAAAAGLTALSLTANLWVVPLVDPLKSARGFSQRVLARAGTEAPLHSFRFWKWRSEYLFYTRREIPILHEVHEVDAFFSRPEPVFLMVEESDREILEQGLQAPAHRLEAADVGGKRMYLLSNRPAGPEAGG